MRVLQQRIELVHLDVQRGAARLRAQQRLLAALLVNCHHPQREQRKGRGERRGQHPRPPRPPPASADHIVSRPFGVEHSPLIPTVQALSQTRKIF